MQLLSAAAHNKPALIVDQLPGAMPHLFAQVSLLQANLSMQAHTCMWSGNAVLQVGTGSVTIQSHTSLRTPSSEHLLPEQSSAWRA